MTAVESRVALLEEWMRGKECENLEFQGAKSRFDFELLAKCRRALANEGGADPPGCHEFTTLRSGGDACLHSEGTTKRAKWLPGPKPGNTLVD